MFALFGKKTEKIEIEREEFMMSSRKTFSKKTAAILLCALVLTLLLPSTAMAFAETDTYEGAVENGVPNGQGTMIYADGSRYEGEWKDGARSGYGTLTKIDGYVHTGEWANGVANGRAFGSWVNGKTLVLGEWKDNAETGYKTVINKEPASVFMINLENNADKPWGILYS